MSCPHSSRIQIEESKNRVRIVFPGRPSEDVRAALKASGFRWAPNEGVWQRHASAGTRDPARRFVQSLKEW